MTAGKGKIERNELADVVVDSFPNTRPFTTMEDIIEVEAMTIVRKLADTAGQATASNLIAAAEMP